MQNQKAEEHHALPLFDSHKWLLLKDNCPVT